MRIRRSSGAGWRMTFVDTMALSFVFLILLVRPPVPGTAPSAPLPAAQPAPSTPAIGMLASSLRHAVRNGPLAGGEVASHRNRVTITLALRWLDHDRIVARARAVSALAAAHGSATLEVVQLLSDRPDHDVYRSLAAMAREVPAAWLVQVASGPPRLRMTVEPADG